MCLDNISLDLNFFEQNGHGSFITPPLRSQRFFLMPNFLRVAAWAFSDRDLKLMRGCAFASFLCCLVNSFR